MKNLVCVMSTVILLSACSKDRDLSVARPCLKYEAEIAEAKTKAELKSKVVSIVEKRVGCQEAAQFSVAFVTALYQEKVQASPEALKALGEQYCVNNYENSSITKQAFDKVEKRRLQRKSQYMLEGCRVGIAESLTLYPQFTKLFMAHGVADVTASSEKEAKVQSAFTRANQISAQLRTKRDAIVLATDRLSQLQESHNTLRQTQNELVASKNAATAAESRAINLESRKADIFSAERNSVTLANATIAKRTIIEDRVRPLGYEFDRAMSSRNSANMARAAAALALDQRRALISSRRSDASSNRSRASSMRSEAVSTY